MKFYIVTALAFSLAGCAVGSQDTTIPPQEDVSQTQPTVPSFGQIDNSCEPVLHGELCDQYQRVNPGDFTPGVTVYEYGITCNAAAKRGCLPWSRDPMYYSTNSWVYCCEGLLVQPPT